MDSGATAWILTSSALVLLMTPGLAFFYGGMVRAKNILAMLLKNYIAMGVITIVWTLVGGSLAFGHLIGGDPMTISDTIVLGNLDYFGLRGIADGASIVEGIPNSAFLMFQLMFAIITPALIVGAVAERMKFGAWTLFIIVWSILVYVPLTTAVWGGGYMAELGALDFAGGLVVHINAGVAALVLAVMIGPRLGYGSRAMRPHSLPLTMLGAGLLWFGWFGFNAGSALAADGTAVNAFVVTNTAAAASVVTWVIVSWIVGKKPSVIGAATGAVAGLVAITPAAGFVGPMPALIIGIGAGIICYLAVELLLKLNIDDALAVFGVHGIGGVWGALATGLFVGIGFGALEVGRGEQVLNQIIGIVATLVWSFVATSVILLAIKFTIGLRADQSDEEAGLDQSIHGEEAYTS